MQMKIKMSQSLTVRLKKGNPFKKRIFNNLMELNKEEMTFFRETYVCAKMQIINNLEKKHESLFSKTILLIWKERNNTVH